MKRDYFSVASTATATVMLCASVLPAHSAEDDSARLGAIEAQMLKMEKQHNQEMALLRAQLAQVRRQLADSNRQAALAQGGSVGSNPHSTAQNPSTRQSAEPLANASQQGGIIALAQPPASQATSSPAAPGSAPVASNPEPAQTAQLSGFRGPPVEQPSLVPSNLAKSDANLNEPGTVAQEQAAAVGTPNSSFRLGGVTITLGGFLEAAGFYRSRNETSDIVSNFNTSVPLPQSPNYNLGEFRASARPSLLSLLVQGKPTADVTLGGYVEADFLAAPLSANGLQLNGYSPRLRQAYATYDDIGTGLHILAGQSWSLLTMDQVGIIPRQENIPLTIDGGYVPGFNWVRQPQLRVAGDFYDHRLWVAASLESPQAAFYPGANGPPTLAGTATYQNPGGVNLNTTSNYSTDIAPDVIGKIAYDPGWGHYEVYGLMRFLHDRVSTIGAGHNNTVLAGGVGGGFILPLIPKVLSFQASGLAGYGIGRYAPGQFPDATLSRTGAPVPLPEFQALFGLVGHPTPDIDLYGYFGTEQAARRSFNIGSQSYGYGNPLYNVAGCSVELSPLTCQANTSGIMQGTLGGWWRVLKGGYGTMQLGAQYSYSRRTIFSGTGRTPSTDDNIALVALRYLPFQ